MTRHDKIQQLCVNYLNKLKGVASKFGLKDFVSKTIEANKRKECKATEEDVEMLARIADDNRVNRVDVPPILHKGYRECHEKDLFYNVRKYPNRGTYSRVSAELYANDLKNEKNNG